MYIKCMFTKDVQIQYYFLENNENATPRMMMYLLCHEHNNEGMKGMEKWAKFEFVLCVRFHKKLI